MTMLGADEHACAKARSALRQAQDELEPLARELLQARTMTREEREDIGRKINAARARITTAQHNLGVYE